ncbi:MAG: PAS domain S-box protein [Labilibaculum sp.]|nr:PAS domain S-box protein [Labilibaculum sp.]MBI9056855.1 PAS domain S-box protein [Labilibaculum sp.]
MTMQNQTKSELYKSLVLNSGDAMFLFDQKGKIIEANNSACTGLNYKKEDLLNLSVPDINPEFQSPDVIADFFKKLVIEKYVKLFSKHQRKDGQVFPIEMSLSLLEENGEQLVLGIARDITEHEQDKANLFSYIDTLEKIHYLLEQAKDIEEMLTDVLNLLQEVFESDRTFLISSQELNDQYKIRPFEIVRNQTQRIFTNQNEGIALSHSQEIHDKIKANKPEVFLASNFENDKDSNAYSELIVPMSSIGANPYLLGVHQCSYDRKWTELEQKLLLDVSRRLSDAIVRFFNDHALQQSEEKYKTLYDHAPLGYHSLDTNGDFIDVNQTWLNLLGYEKEEVIGKNYGDLLHPDYRDNFVKNFPTLKSRGYVQNVHFKLRHKNGHYIFISLEGCTGCHPDGSFKQTYCVIQDISARIKAEEELKESEARFKNLVQSVPIPLGLLDSKTLEIKYINNRFVEKFGYTIEEIPTIERWNDLVYPDLEYREWVVNNWENALEYCLKHNTDIPTDIYKIKCKNGDYKEMSVSGIVLGEDFLINFADVTEQKEYERKLKKALEKAEENEKLKTAFLANMSHEIRTPMNGIMGFADLLQTPQLSGEKHQRYVDLIMKSGDRMLSTINDIIEVSKIETKQITPIYHETNINEIIKYYYSFFLPEADVKGIELNYKFGLSSSEALILLDKSMLDSILTNLIKNAIKYTNSGMIDFGYTKNEDELEFYVKDTGIGIPEEQQKIIFERFRQVELESTKAIEGSGLGLSIAKAYTELLGGKIWMESKKDIGSQFYFTIPYRLMEK